jgi:MFS family permease
MMLAGAFVLGICLALTALSQNFWQAMVMMFISGAGASAFQLLNNSLIMQEADQAYYGRVMSLTMMAWGLNGLVGFPFGLLADGIGERQTIFIMAMLVIAVTGVATLLHLALGRRTPPVVVPPVPTLARGD